VKTNQLFLGGALTFGILLIVVVFFRPGGEKGQFSNSPDSLNRTEASAAETSLPSGLERTAVLEFIWRVIDGDTKEEIPNHIVQDLGEGLFWIEADGYEASIVDTSTFQSAMQVVVELNQASLGLFSHIGGNEENELSFFITPLIDQSKWLISSTTCDTLTKDCWEIREYIKGNEGAEATKLVKKWLDYFLANGHLKDETLKFLGDEIHFTRMVNSSKSQLFPVLPNRYVVTQWGGLKGAKGSFSENDKLISDFDLGASEYVKLKTIERITEYRFQADSSRIGSICGQVGDIGDIDSLDRAWIELIRVENSEFDAKGNKSPDAMTVGRERPDENGAFCFTNLIPGMYYLNCAWPSGRGVEISTLDIVLEYGEDKDIETIYSREPFDVELIWDNPSPSSSEETACIEIVFVGKGREIGRIYRILVLLPPGAKSTHLFGVPGGSAHINGAIWNQKASSTHWVVHKPPQMPRQRERFMGGVDQRLHLGNWFYGGDR
jgi:hypothetical protein